MIAVTAGELQAWLEQTARGWKNLLAAHPQILAFPCDIRETHSVAEMLQHIVAVELRYTELLNGLPQTAYEAIPFDSVEAIYATHDRAMAMLEPLYQRDAAWWETAIEFGTRSAGTLRSRRRTILVHLLMHGIRHYAQLATLVRQHGIHPEWQMDYLMMDPE